MRTVSILIETSDETAKEVFNMFIEETPGLIVVDNDRVSLSIRLRDQRLECI
jgi:hypothetical protein